MTKYQKKFLLEFFKNKDYPNWDSIANRLLDTGYCTVGGNRCIWIGGVGNYIETKSSADYIDCMDYTFDLELFLNSEWCKQILESHVKSISDKIDELKEELTDLLHLQSC